nr:helix-turn-helix domain-containing protein [Streptomyces sp. NEAU-HV9]
MQAAELFALGHDSAAIAKQLRVSVQSVHRWRQAWGHGGSSALESAGPASRPKLSEALFAVLEQERAKGPVSRLVQDQGRGREPAGPAHRHHPRPADQPGPGLLIGIGDRAAHQRAHQRPGHTAVRKVL